MSAKGFWITQDGHVANLIPPVSAAAATKSARFNMAEWAHASILLQLGVAGGPCGAITVLVYAAVTGGSGVAIPFKYFEQEAATTPFDVFGALNQATASGFTPGNTSSENIADALYAIELDAADLLAAANGTYVELDIAVGSLGSSALLISSIALLSAGRNTSDQSPSVQV